MCASSWSRTARRRSSDHVSATAGSEWPAAVSRRPSACCARGSAATAPDAERPSAGTFEQQPRPCRIADVAWRREPSNRPSFDDQPNQESSTPAAYNAGSTANDRPRNAAPIEVRGRFSAAAAGGRRSCDAHAAGRCRPVLSIDHWPAGARSAGRPGVRGGHRNRDIPTRERGRQDRQQEQAGDGERPHQVPRRGRRAPVQQLVRSGRRQPARGRP